MNHGMYVSAAGALTSMHRQDVLANNLANINTVGFKPDFALTRQRLPERLENTVADTDPQDLLEQLGGGLWPEATRIRFAQGTIVQTGKDLDLAIEGEGFFVTTTGKGSGVDHLRLTRDGRMTLNAKGELVLAATGMAVLDVNDRPITLDRRAPVLIGQDGSVIQNGAPIARVQISRGPGESMLVKTGDNMLRAANGARWNRASDEPVAGRVIQGATEAAAVDPVKAMNDMINASRAVNSNITMMQYHDNLLGQIINTYARVT